MTPATPPYPILHFTKLVGLPLMLKLRTKFEVCSFSRFRNMDGGSRIKTYATSPHDPRSPATSPYPILHFSRLVWGLSLMLKQRAEF